MGYYTAYNWELHLKKGVTPEEFNTAISQDIRRLDEQAADKVWYWEGVKADAERYIEGLPDHCKAGYDDLEPLFEFLAKFVEGDMNANGDDSEDIWRVEFDGNGGWKYEVATIIYDYLPYKQFMKELGDALPPTLKEELEKWNTARQI